MDSTPFVPSNAIRAVGKLKLDEHSKIVLLMLMGHADWRTGLCWPSTTTLATEASISVRSVRYALRKLELAGLLETEPRAGNTPRYWVRLTPARGAAPPVETPARGAAKRTHHVPEERVASSLRDERERDPRARKALGDVRGKPAKMPLGNCQRRRRAK